MISIGNEWEKLLDGESEKDYYIKLRQFLKNEYEKHTVYPDMNNIFNALKLTPHNEVKVVILGQDPYHGEGQAHGLAFSVPEGIDPPPSLVNMFKELGTDVGISVPAHGCLECWARQGVLLLNTALTVRKAEPASHRGIGWEMFTDKIIELLNEREKPIVFMLWGSHAHAKQGIITNKQHIVLKAPHPSPLSVYRGFFGCRHFSIANDFLMSIGEKEIDWNVI